jgi:type I restriction-modification system DNA methylase subunit
MDQATHNRIVSFIWGIADDVLRDLFKRGKYPDVILPMCVLRRMDAVLEPSKRAVLETKKCSMPHASLSSAPRSAMQRARHSTTLQNLLSATSNPVAASSSFWPILRTI